MPYARKVPTLVSRRLFTGSLPAAISSRLASSTLACWARASTCFCTRGVSTKPGQMALQVTPVVAVSSATLLVKPTMPCLLAT